MPKIVANQEFVKAVIMWGGRETLALFSHEQVSVEDDDRPLLERKAAARRLNIKLEQEEIIAMVVWDPQQVDHTLAFGIPVEALRAALELPLELNEET